MSRFVFYLTTSTALQSQVRAADYHQAHGVTPIVLLPENGTNVFRAGWNADAAVGNVRRHIAGPLYVGLWADNVARDEQRGGSTLLPWDDDAGWSVLLGNLIQLRTACERHDVAGVVWDGEIYTSTPQNNGGRMGKGAWPDGGRAKERGQAVREALGSLTLGQYVLVDDARTLPGWKQFWGGAFRKGDLLMDEGGYLSAPEARAFAARGVRNLPGRTIRGGRFRGQVPRGSFWVYPWGDEVNLAAFARLWRR